MIVKINSKRQVTIPAHVLNAMGVGPGDELELTKTSAGYLLRPRHIDYSRLGPLREKIPADHPPFAIFRSFAPRSTTRLCDTKPIRVQSSQST